MTHTGALALRGAIIFTLAACLAPASFAIEQLHGGSPLAGNAGDQFKSSEFVVAEAGESDGKPAWAAEAKMNPDYVTDAAASSPASGLGEATTQYFGIGEPTSAPAWAAEAKMNPGYANEPAVTPPEATAADEPAPMPTGGEGVTQYFGIGEPSAPPAWAAEAAMNPDYAATPSAAPAVGEQAVEACRDALNAEALADKLLFRLSSWSVSPSNYGVLDSIAKIANDCGAVVIEVAGFTDNTGKPASNKELSELRAKAIVAYLTKAGVTADKLKAVGYGEERPIASNDTAEGRGKNRRIEFSVSAP